MVSGQIAKADCCNALISDLIKQQMFPLLQVITAVILISIQMVSGPMETQKLLHV